METDPLLLQLLSTGIAHCRAAVGEHEGLLASLFMAGLLGSITHCVGMCGPFVLAQTVSRLEDRPAAQMREWHRLAGAALVPYHLGRATTYAALGAAAAALAAGMIHVTGLRWLSAALLVLAALVLSWLCGASSEWTLGGSTACPSSRRHWRQRMVEPSSQPGPSALRPSDRLARLLARSCARVSSLRPAVWCAGCRRGEWPAVGRCAGDAGFHVRHRAVARRRWFCRSCRRPAVPGRSIAADASLDADQRRGAFLPRLANHYLIYQSSST